jgi:hypothetical protein
VKADTLARALALVQRLREASTTGKPVEFKPNYSECLDVEMEIKNALRKVNVTVEHA